MRLAIWRLWVQIPAPFTGCTFFHINLLQKLYRCLFKKTENKRWRGRRWPIINMARLPLFLYLTFVLRGKRIGKFLLDYTYPSAVILYARWSVVAKNLVKCFARHFGFGWFCVQYYKHHFWRKSKVSLNKEAEKNLLMPESIQKRNNMLF